MTELQIKKIEVDWLTLINLAFEKKGWGKVYTLYTYGEVSINVMMDSFDFGRNKAFFKIECIYPNDNYYYEFQSYSYVEYHLDNFSKDFFSKLILKRVKRIIEDIICERTKSKAEHKYSRLKFYSWNINEDKIDELGYTEEYRIINCIKNEFLREELISTFNSKLIRELNKLYDEKVNQYVRNNKECSQNMIQLLESVNRLIEQEK